MKPQEIIEYIKLLFESDVTFTCLDCVHIEIGENTSGKKVYRCDKQGSYLKEKDLINTCGRFEEADEYLTDSEYEDETTGDEYDYDPNDELNSHW